MIPVICTTNIEPELINEFLVKAYAADTDASENLCVLTTQDWSHYRDEARLSPGEAQKQGRVAVPRGGGPMESPSRPPWTKRFETPFKNRDPEDIAQNLQTAEGLLSTMNKDFCVVLDGQTVQDKSVLLVKTSRGPESNLPSDNESSIVQYRTSFEQANSIVQGTRQKGKEQICSRSLPNPSRASNTANSMPSTSKRECKTYSSRDSHVVTHRSTNLPFNCLCMAERTGCPVFS
ncbi:hypothetical protein KCU98_g5329, partial [Aureobasidium melanogenum]